MFDTNYATDYGGTRQRGDGHNSDSDEGGFAATNRVPRVRNREMNNSTNSIESQTARSAMRALGNDGEGERSRTVGDNQARTADTEEEEEESKSQLIPVA